MLVNSLVQWQLGWKKTLKGWLQRGDCAVVALLGADRLFTLE